MSVYRRWRLATLVATTVVVVVLSLLYLFAYGMTGSGGAYLVPPLIVVLGWPLVSLRRRPVLATGVILASATALTPLVNVEVVGPVGVVAILTAVGRLARTRPWRVSVPVTVIALVLQIALATAYYSRGRGALLSTSAIVGLAIVCVWTIGSLRRQRRQNLEARRADETERAVDAERLRIARELHDQIAHSLGAIAIQAGVGRRVIANQPAEARNALDAIETTSRQTLAELRRTLTALRRTDPEGVPTAPAPGLGDLEQVITTARHAGVQVDVDRAGTARDLPADLDLAAFRIVQEGVTNVVRHAGTDRCRVLLDYRDDELAIEVLDDGPGTGTTGTGYGLVGMRERTTLLDGHFAAGPRPEGGFRVFALVPLPVNE